MAQLLLQQGRVPEALQYFEKAAELSRTEAEIVNALSYAEATRTQLEVGPFIPPLLLPSDSYSDMALQVQEKYPQLANKLQGMAGGLGAR